MKHVKATGAVCALAVTLVAGSAASAATSRFMLQDHPDGDVNPPPYGLRLDNALDSLGGDGGATTFSFNAFNDVIMTVNDMGGSITINIAGTVYGGEDDGGSYGFGEGGWALDFTYTMNVNANGTGWDVAPNSSLNNGTITALAGNTDLAAGTTITFYDSTANSFLFLQDDHRLGGHAEAGMGYWVGRGWNSFSSDGSDSAGTQDWLFIGKLIPLPSAAGMGLAGLGLLGVRRRR